MMLCKSSFKLYYTATQSSLKLTIFPLFSMLSGVVKNKKLRYNECTKSIRRDNKMAYVISDDCVSCGACAGGCPVGAISEGDGKYEIDADACVDCGACEAACPTGAISEA